MSGVEVRDVTGAVSSIGSASPRAGERRRAVFLDVDGTYVNEKGLVPDSAHRAVVRARAKGHLVFLCTGRAVPEINEHILAAGFDGVVASAGAHVVVGEQVLANRSVPVESVRRVVEFFDARGVAYYLQSPGALYGRPEGRELMRELLFGLFDRIIEDAEALAERRRGLGIFLDSMVVDADLVRDDISKVSFLDAGLTLAELREEFDGEFDVIPATIPAFGPHSGEMSVPGVHKAAGIEVVLAHIGMVREDTVAFGDGFNDLEMLEFAGVGVAMASAHDDVKARADVETPDPDDDGIARSFAALGLI